MSFHRACFVHYSTILAFFKKVAMIVKQKHANNKFSQKSAKTIFPKEGI